MLIVLLMLHVFVCICLNVWFNCLLCCLGVVVLVVLLLLLVYCGSLGCVCTWYCCCRLVTVISAVFGWVSGFLGLCDLVGFLVWANALVCWWGGCFSWWWGGVLVSLILVWAYLSLELVVCWWDWLDSSGLWVIWVFW